MSTVAVPAACLCGSVGRTDLRQCPEHFRIYSGDIRLTSVGRVVRTLINPPCWRCKFPMYSDHAFGCSEKDKLDNARYRGRDIDRLFAEYVMGTLRVIPAGTHHEAPGLLHKLIAWYDKQAFKKVGVQVLLGNGKYGGIVDFTFDDMIVDLKATSSILPSHELQVGGYYDLASGQKAPFILHTTKALKEARFVPLKRGDILDDWCRLRDAYEVLERRGVLKSNEIIEDL